jgi:DNA polymerase III delta prime subunit
MHQYRIFCNIINLKERRKKVLQIEDKIKEINNKIEIISASFVEMLDDEEDQLTKTEYGIIKKIDNIEQSFDQLVDNYNNFKKDGEEEEVEEIFTLACNMLDSSLEETARLLEITI